MGKIKKAFGNMCQGVIDWAMGNGLMQKTNQEIIDSKYPFSYEKDLLSLAKESIVMLKNDNALPLNDDEIAVFGRCQIDSFYSGYGSGGDVHPERKTNIIDGLNNYNIKYNNNLYSIYKEWCLKNEPDHGWWGHWPYYYPEMELDESLVCQISKKNETALFIIGRACGEDRDNKLEKGSYYLTDIERDNLSLVTKHFKKTILIINSGNLIDLNFTTEYKIDAILYCWQLGSVYWDALASILNGESPSGKLPETIVNNYYDVPSFITFGQKYNNYYNEDIFVGYRYYNKFTPNHILYPFGYGLTYSKFDIKLNNFEFENGIFTFKISIKNIGNSKAKEVVELYLEKPSNLLSQPLKVLVGFKKTKLLDIEEVENITISINKYDISSYFEEESSYILESGIYKFYLGNSSLDNSLIKEMYLDYEIIEKLNTVCPLNTELTILTKDGLKKVKPKNIDLKSRILNNIKPNLEFKDNKFNIQDIINNNCTIDEFIQTLTLKDLSDLTHGEGGMGSSLGVIGNAGVFGGITPRLRELGIRPIICADGPAGIRIRKKTHLLPCGSAIASTFNLELIENVFKNVSEEMAYHGVDVLLSPGMNIKRNPLCGRNFEYFSEDPLHNGLIASAVVKGIQANGKSACPKHFACNNQEYKRNKNDSIMTERALREIYLKGFEIMVKNSNPCAIMTSYNKINGIYAHYNYDLVNTILKKEWNYQGVVITDWWMRKAKSNDFKGIKDNAYRVRSGIDVLMPGNMSYIRKKYKFDKKIFKTIGKVNGLRISELQQTAKNVINFLINIDNKKE